MGEAACFVGRVGELAELAGVLSRAQADVAGSLPARGAVVVVVGEPGAGKTTLVEVALAGRRAVWAKAREGGGAPPLWLWDHVLDELGETVVRTGPTGLTGADRFGLFDEVARRLVTLHEERPFVVVLDDLQWADEESLAFLDFIAPDAELHRLVVIATVRHGELAAIPDGATVIELGGLELQDVRRLLSSREGEQVEAGLAQEVWEHTGGNPFFVTEVDRLLRTRAREAAGHWRSTVPQGVRAVLSRRFARLAQPVSRTVQAGAELGEAIDPILLSAAVERPAEEVLDDLAVAVEAGLVRRAPDGTLTFSHSLVREAARTELPAAVRRQLNRRAAVALRERPGEPAVSRIAQHLCAADDPEAGSWAVRAGDAAAAASMYAEAVVWYDRARARGVDPDSPGLRLARGEALSRCGRIPEAEKEFLDAARLARGHGDPEPLARAALGVGSIGGGFEVRQLDAGQQALLAEAIAALGDPDSPVLASLLARRSIAESLDADHDTRVALADHAVAMARRVGDDAALGAALGAWCDAHAGPAHLAGRLTASAELLAVARRSGDSELELLARRLALVAALEAGDLAAVHRHAVAFSAVADRLRLPQFTWYARLVEGMLAHLAGDLDRAAELAVEAAALGRRAGSVNARMLTDGALIPAIDRDRGDPTYLDRLTAVNAGLAEVNRGHDMAAVFELYGIGYGAERADVEAGLPGWTQMWRATGQDDGLTVYLGFHLARGAAFVGDLDLIAEVEPTLLPYADRLALDGTGSVCYGPVDVALGAMAAARGDQELAERRYRAAIDTCRRIGAPLLQALVERESGLEGSPVALPVRRGVFRRDGEVWLVEFAGSRTRLRHSKGLADLAVLLARPDRDVHVYDLVGAVGADRSDAGELIDAAARAAYEKHIRDLDERIEEAEAAEDDDRAAALDAERTAVIEHLAAALGIGGRPRIVGSDVERARKAVGMRVREACRRIDAELPELGRHLRSAVRTGTWCSYRPDTPTTWDL